MSNNQLTIADVADLAGVDRRSIDRYLHRGSMPVADGYLGRTPWWHRHTIEHWLATRPKPGRPPKSTNQ
jgi:predicted DNA-binding transcriptional regulator AlpA